MDCYGPTPNCSFLGTTEGLTCYQQTTFINNGYTGLDGYDAVPIYLFRRKGCDLSFAYSLDATGQNIPAVTDDNEWVYVGMVASEQLKTDQEAQRQLRAEGFYMFKG